MRLINVKTLEMSDFEDCEAVCYAILSHTWGIEEVSLQDYQNPVRRRKMKGFNKIMACCRQAERDGIEWAWVDTCCIDKTNGAELSEAINSMYKWYQSSAVCYAFLENVFYSDLGGLSEESLVQLLQNARWFKRGWCLQELLAPRNVEFYASDWTEFGTKRSLCDIISQVTTIPRDALLGGYLRPYPAAQKMSWASFRETARVEDEAYCLMGIFDVNMPLIYGEGRKAFQRLQNEIWAKDEDTSLLLWKAPHGPMTDSTHIYSVQASIARHFQLGDLLPPPEKGSSVHQAMSDIYQMRRKRREPSQLTSRGRRVHMFAKRIAPGSIQGATLLLWAGSVSSDTCVCIALMGVDVGWSDKTYYRVHPGRVFPVDHKEIETFELMDLYLGTKYSAPSFVYSAKTPWPTLPNNDLRVLIYSTPATKVSAVRSFPDTGCQRQDGIPGYENEGHQVDQLYYVNIMPPGTLWNRYRRTAILLKAEKGTVDGISTILLLVFVRVSENDTGCWFRRLPDTDYLTDLHVNRLAEEHEPNDVTDRYSSDLFGTGEVTSVSVKSLNRPNASSRNSREGGPARWTLHVRLNWS